LQIKRRAICPVVSANDRESQERLAHPRLGADGHLSVIRTPFAHVSTDAAQVSYFIYKFKCNSYNLMFHIAVMSIGTAIHRLPRASWRLASGPSMCKSRTTQLCAVAAWIA